MRDGAPFSREILARKVSSFARCHSPVAQRVIFAWPALASGIILYIDRFRKRRNEREREGKIISSFKIRANAALPQCGLAAITHCAQHVVGNLNISTRSHLNFEFNSALACPCAQRAIGELALFPITGPRDC